MDRKIDEPKKFSEKQIQRKLSKHRLELRNLQPDDYADIKEIMELAYPNFGGSWSENEFRSQLTRFPEGQICIEDNGKVVAAALSLIVEYAKYGDSHTYAQITDHGRIENHDPDGDTLYAMDIFVHPKLRGLRLGRRLYDARKELCQNLNLRRIVAGGWIPGYRKFKEEMTPQKYIELVKNREVFDQVLTFQLANEFHVRKILTNYWPDDRDQNIYATLLEWINIYYTEEDRLIGGKKTIVRTGVVQWQMRTVTDLKEFLSQVEFYVDTVSGYKADFVVFPELFIAPLMAKYNQMSPSDSIRELATFTEPIREEMLQLAVSYNVNIISGSMPEYKEDGLYNVAYCLKRNGTYEEQYKIHITPSELSYWGMKGGNRLNVIDTDMGKIGILICYDIEFPELSRVLAERGAEILFVPYLTDTKNAHLRVKNCAQARAIENECYVVISGCVGNLPNVENMDIQYAESAVFTPSDFMFSHDAVAATAQPNTEMTLIVDLDLDLLKQCRTQGSVRNLADRRHDLYTITWKGI